MCLLILKLIDWDGSPMVAFEVDDRHYVHYMYIRKMTVRDPMGPNRVRGAASSFALIFSTWR